MPATDLRTPAEKAKSKRAHANVMLVIGYITVACGAAAAILAFSVSGRIPRPISFLRSAGSPGESLELPRGPHRTPDLVRWRPWDDDAFAVAGREDRLVLLSVCPLWSHACHVMDETTYAKPEVAEWTRSHVVPVRANPEAVAEVAFRFPEPVWPVTALLLPSGEVISSGSLIGPDHFLPWASKVEAAYRARPETLRAAALQARKNAEAERIRLLAAETPTTFRSADLLASLQAHYDGTYGGFGAAWKVPASDTLDALDSLADEKNAGWMLEGALRGWLALEDPVWGGFYRASNTRDWRSPEFEKPVLAQAQAIRIFARETARRGLSAERALVVERTVRFADQFLGGGDGLFASGLDADVLQPDGGWAPGRSYYARPEAERRKVGLPRAVGGRPVAANAAYAEALIEAGKALGRGGIKDRGLALLERVHRAAVAPNGAVARMIENDPLGAERSREAGALADELAVVRADVAAYLATKDVRWRARAESIFGYCVKELLDAQTGALRAYPVGGNVSRRSWFDPVDPDGTARLAAVILRLDPKSPRARINSRGLTHWVLTHRASIDPVLYGNVAGFSPYAAH